MQRHAIYALTLVGCLCIFAWILLAPLLGLPFGVAGSTGPSMGNDGMMIHVWVDGEPAIGDVVIYDQHGQLSNDRVVHRVVDETEQGYVTKGDANPYTDQSVEGVGYVTEENLIGVVLFQMPLPKFIVFFTLSMMIAAIILNWMLTNESLGYTKWLTRIQEQNGLR